MFRFVILIVAITYVNAGGYGAPLALNTGYAAPVRGVPVVGPVSAAIHSTRTVEYIPVALHQELAAPQIIDVEPYEQPVQMIFRSSTSPLLIQQIHNKGVPYHEATRSEEEPSQVLHEVYKPVIQEFREVIQPFRKITQEVKPVLEEVRTLVAKGEGYRAAPVAPLALKNEPLLETPLLAAKGGY